MKWESVNSNESVDSGEKHRGMKEEKLFYIDEKWKIYDLHQW